MPRPLGNIMRRFTNGEDLPPFAGIVPAGEALPIPESEHRAPGEGAASNPSRRCGTDQSLQIVAEPRQVQPQLPPCLQL